MSTLLNLYGNISLKSKLMVSFIGLIVFPLIILSFFSFALYSQEIQNTVVKSAIQSNDQVIKNLDAFLEMLAKLSEYPLKDKTLRLIMKRDYSLVQNPEYERSLDFDTAKNILNNNIKGYSDMIDSIYLYRAETYEIRGRIPTDSIFMAYEPSKEKWLTDIVKLGGGCAIVGIHKGKQKKPNGDYIITVGRSISEPGSNEQIGTIIIDVDVKSLGKLWKYTNLTNSSKFYLLDEKSNVIFSKDENQIGKNISQIFDKKIDIDDKESRLIELSGKKQYIITSTSKVSRWRVITLIPKKELFSYIDKMFGITVITALVIIILSIIIAIFIATGVTKPLYKLNNKMRQVAKGNFDIKIDIGRGEVGEIARTVEKMIGEIKTLIAKIYMEEEEKRNAEMNALQSQINPHFLYNTLNSIKWMANIQGASSIENAISSLSSLFSFTAKRSGDFISIKDEIDFNRDYLRILNLRYYNKFTVKFEIDEEVYNYKTLKFLLQPVIENAIFHGIEGVERKGLLKISIYKKDEVIIFEVEDNGKGMSKDTLDSIFKEENDVVHNRFNSIGIQNIQKRIVLHFGEKYGILIKSIDNQGTLVTIVIPALTYLE